jgi:hypothetical protein
MGKPEGDLLHGSFVHRYEEYIKMDVGVRG